MTKITTEEPLGGCPECGNSDGMVNYGRNTYFHCATHKTIWFYGSNICSTWQYETEESRAELDRRFADYRDVDPIFPDLAEERRENEAALARLEKLPKPDFSDCPGGITPDEDIFDLLGLREKK